MTIRFRRVSPLVQKCIGMFSVNICSFSSGLITGKLISVGLSAQVRAWQVLRVTIQVVTGNIDYYGRRRCHYHH
uniref:Uncharacterized protein n=1 Tax=Anguilla anguilla TaxID=7936 RepID=A0A0E9WH99_ANGAN